MGDNILDKTELSGYQKKLTYNQKLLKLAEENGEADKVELYKRNIDYYKKLLGIKVD